MKQIILIAATALLAACAPKLDVKGSNPAPTVNAFTHEIKGPSLDGIWKSGCEVDTWNNGYVIFDVEIKNQDIVRKTSHYLDFNCTQKSNTYSGIGLFRYVASYSSDIYEVEYQFKMDNGHYYTGDNIRRIGAKLFISDRRVGNGITPDIQLNLVIPKP